MSQRILLTSFSFNVTPEEFEKIATEVAPAFCDVPGLEWKIYLIEREKQTAGAVYLFRDDDALQSFKLSPLVASVLSHPALSNFEFKEREILETPSAINYAPLKHRATMAEA